MSSERQLRRSWKLYKPHLPKSISLPQLQIVPPNRPMFTCLHCGFTNTLIPLCLWCAWSSDEATARWYHDMPRQRRLTAPARMAWLPPRVVPDKKRQRASLESVSAIWFPLTSRNSAVLLASTPPFPGSNIPIDGMDFLSTSVSQSRNAQMGCDRLFKKFQALKYRID
jgi:hypothetical protein